MRRDAVVPPGEWDLDGAGFRGNQAQGVGLAPHGHPVAAISPAAGIRQPDLPRTGFRHRRAATVTPLLFSAAVNVAYTPAAAGHWVGSPGDVGAALDELAERLDALGG